MIIGRFADRFAVMDFFKQHKDSGVLYIEPYASSQLFDSNDEHNDTNEEQQGKNEEHHDTKGEGVYSSASRVQQLPTVQILFILIHH